MPQLHIIGWRHGLKAVSMIMLLKEELLLGLEEATGCVDRVLNNETVVLDVNDLAKAHELAHKLEVLGVDVIQK